MVYRHPLSSIQHPLEDSGRNSQFSLQLSCVCVFVKKWVERTTPTGQRPSNIFLRRRMEAPYTKHSLCNSSFSPNQKLQPTPAYIFAMQVNPFCIFRYFQWAPFTCEKPSVHPDVLRITSDIAAWDSSTFLQSSEHYYSTFMVPGWKKAYPHLPVIPINLEPGV